MTRHLAALLAATLAVPALAAPPAAPPAASPVAAPTKEKRPAMESSPLYAVKVKTIDGRETTLADFKGKALLIVNTASQCGYTPQYAGLEQLYGQYKARGFEVLGFPSNDFGGQEPGTEQEIKKFCELRYKTSFPMFSKVKVKGGGEQHPLYATLTKTPGLEGEVKWNFGKFLVSPEGKVVARFDSKVEPTSPELTQKLESVLPAAR
jgi:glutathione peroxidase